MKKIYRLKNFMKDDIWTLEMEELSTAKARFIKYVKVMLITIKTFANERIGFQAVALSFFSTMSVVPFIAIIFAITGGLGLADKLKELLYGYFENTQQTIDIILGFAQNIIDSAQSSAVGLVSALMFAFIVIWMMLNVERVFNNVWRVRKTRNIFKRLSYVLAMILISPFVVMVFFAGSFVYSHALEYVGIDPESLGAFKSILAWLLFADSPLMNRALYTAGVFGAVVSHLILDEICAISPMHLSVKKSFGNALKWSVESKIHTVLLYLLVLALGYFCCIV